MSRPLRDLIIIGFSGAAREVYFLAVRAGFTIRGFLDDNIAVHSECYHGVPVLGGISQWVDFSDCDFIVAIGSPAIRKKIVDDMLVIGTPSFATLIDPAAVVDQRYVVIKPGSIVSCGTVCTVDITIGAHTLINRSCTIGHDTQMGDFVTIAPMVAVSGNVTIEDGVELGTGSSIRQGLVIGERSMVGMGSVVTKNVPEATLVFGCPAKAIKTIAL